MRAAWSCDAERDEYLRLFSHHKEMSAKAAQWIKQWMKESKMKEPSAEELQEAEEWFNRLIERMPLERRLAGADVEDVIRVFGSQTVLSTIAPEQRLAGLDPEQRLAGLDPEQRLAGLDAQEIVAASPITVLRLLPEDYIATLAPHVQQKIRQRLRDESH